MPVKTPNDQTSTAQKAGSIRRIWRGAKKMIVGVIGATVLLFGVALLVLPGPGLVVIAAGLGILALEFAWARRWLNKGRDAARKTKATLKARKREQN